MQPSIINSDLRVLGDFSAKTMTLATGSVTDNAVAAAAAIDDAKLKHRHYAAHRQPLGSAVTAATELVHRAYAAGTILDIGIAVDSVPAGGTQSVTVDVKKSTAGGAAASILTAPVTVSTSSAARTVIAAALAAVNLAAGDLLYVCVTVAGTGGTQAAGLLVSILIAENPIP